ncbi:hypothetical protein V6M85_02255 [Sulfolobus tengchongensis]|uniref:Uncharacterized protein n=1 Tax=Sulfolobus tengchongensis TaxID=207809 RepID=A0AAX4L2U9_9CREN
MTSFNRDTKAVTRSFSMVDYSLSLLIVMKGKVFSSVVASFNQVWFENMERVRESLI